MTLFPAAVLLAACSGAALAASAPTLADVDARLAEVKTAHEAFGRCVGPRTDAPAAGTCLEKVLASPELKQTFAFDLVVRQVCLSLAAGRPESCDILADVKGNPESGQRMCRRLYAMSRFSRDLISGSAGTAKSCSDWCDLAPTLPPRDLVGRVCGSLLKGEYSRACEYIVEWKKPGKGYSPIECEWEMQSVLGISAEEACRRNRRPGSDICVATERFKKAKTAAGSEACGGDALCLVMTGEDHSACARLDADLQEKACPAGPAPTKVALTERDCALARAKAVERLEDAGRLLKDPEIAKQDGFAARRREVSELEAAQKALEAAYRPGEKTPR